MSGISPVEDRHETEGPASVPARSPERRSGGLENYFNYFTEIEACYQRWHGSANLLSPLDWALIESWKDAGVPLEAVEVGIQRTFEKYARRPRRFQKINSLGYCTQEVMRAADQVKTAQAEGGAAGGAGKRRAPEPSFTAKEIVAYLTRGAEALEKAAAQLPDVRDSSLAGDFTEAAGTLRRLVLGVPEDVSDLQPLENLLTALEEKLTPAVTRAASVELVAEIRQEGERGMASCRRNMTAPQIELLQRQFLKKRLFEHYGVPRLSLFYL
ncbi:MAG TPA: hypothetical protein VJV74_17305 [Terriglobia bacterium]|nr:hypothetical protein [Terriglobia bacterium]